MSDDFVDPTELLRAEYERQMVELRCEYAAAGSRRERSRVRRRMRQLHRHTMLGRLGDGSIIRW